MQRSKEYFESLAVLTKQQVAEMLNISVRSVDNCRKEGMPCIKIKGLGVRFKAKDVLDWVDNC